MYSIKCTQKGFEYYLECGKGQVPNRTILSTHFSWVKQDLRTKFSDEEQALKWFVFLAKKMNHLQILSYVWEKEDDSK